MKQETPKHQPSQPGTQDGERCGSEFIRQAQAFANYMAKEYAEPADGDIAMLLLALDATGAERTAHLHCMTGNRMRIAADIADRMRDKGWGRDLFRNARIMAGGDDGATDELLRRNRRRLRIDYAVLVLPIIMVYSPQPSPSSAPPTSGRMPSAWPCLWASTSCLSSATSSTDAVR